MFRLRLSRRAALAAPLAWLACPVRAGEPWVTVAEGIEAPLPTGFELLILDDCTWMREDGNIRTPLRIMFSRDPDFAFHEAMAPRRWRALRYTIRTLGGGGSGGPVHELRALRRLPDGSSLGMIAQRQAEFAPDFGIALEVLAAARPLS